MGVCCGCKPCEQQNECQRQQRATRPGGQWRSRCRSTPPCFHTRANNLWMVSSRNTESEKNNHGMRRSTWMMWVRSTCWHQEFAVSSNQPKWTPENTCMYIVRRKDCPCRCIDHVESTIHWKHRWWGSRWCQHWESQWNNFHWNMIQKQQPRRKMPSNMRKNHSAVTC